MRQVETDGNNPTSIRSTSQTDISKNVEKWVRSFGPKTAQVLTKIHTAEGVYTTDHEGTLSIWDVQSRIESFREGGQWLAAIPRCNDNLNEQLGLEESLRKTVLRETVEKSYKGQYSLKNGVTLNGLVEKAKILKADEKVRERFKIGTHGNLIKVGDERAETLAPDDIEVAMDSSGQITEVLLIEPERTEDLAKTLQYPRGPVVKAIATIVHYNDSRARNMHVKAVDFEISGCISRKENHVLNLPRDSRTRTVIWEGINSARHLKLKID